MSLENDLERIPEPDEVMVDSESVTDWDSVGAPGGPFFAVYHLSARSASRLARRGGTILDLACGTARFLCSLFEWRPDLRGIGVEMSAGMLQIARQNLGETGLMSQIDLRRSDMSSFLGVVPERIDLVTCLNAFHHLPTREKLRETMGEIARLRERDGCAVWIYDLTRPREERLCDWIPRAYEGTSSRTLPDAFARDWRNSLRAGWTLDELQGAAVGAGLLLESGEFSHGQIHWTRQAGCNVAHAEWPGPVLESPDRERVATMLDGFSSVP